MSQKLLLLRNLCTWYIGIINNSNRLDTDTLNESLANEVCRVWWYPVTPSPSILRVAGAEDPQEKIVVAGVGDGGAAPPGVEPGHLGLSGRVDKHSLGLSISGWNSELYHHRSQVYGLQGGQNTYYFWQGRRSKSKSKAHHHINST